MNRQNIEAFFATLKAANPEPRTELEYSSNFELLAAVLLSAQATDVGVNKATRKLYPVANTPQQILDLGLEGLERYIKTIGLTRSKARHLRPRSTPSKPCPARPSLTCVTRRCLPSLCSQGRVWGLWRHSGSNISTCSTMIGMSQTL